MPYCPNLIASQALSTQESLPVLSGEGAVYPTISAGYWSEGEED